MFIPKDKMPGLIKALKVVIDCAEGQYDPPVETDLEPEELELVKQVYDRACLVLQGDANFLEVSAYYGVRPERGI